VNEPEPVLRIARERGELAWGFQTKYRAQKPQAVEKLDGFGVGHWRLDPTYNGFW
jgi:hypothetical protein